MQVLIHITVCSRLQQAKVSQLLKQEPPKSVPLLWLEAEAKALHHSTLEELCGPPHATRFQLGIVVGG